MVQLREKAFDDRALLARAQELVMICREAQVPFIVNDRADLALAAGADGVHLGQDDCPPEVARRILGPDALIGLSTHCPEQMDAAQGEPVDYVSAGPVLPTATHPDREATGLGYIGYARRSSRLPFFVTGDANPTTVGAMVRAGADRFVAVRWLTGSPDPERAARQLAEAIDRAVAQTP